MANPPASPEPSAHVTHGGHDPVAHTLALLQPWIDYVPQQQRRLGLFICLALAIHAAICLFLVIDTSVAQMRHESRLYVSVASPQALAVSGEPADQLWDRLTDPRVFLLPMTSPTDLVDDMPPVSPDTSPSFGVLPQPAPPETYRAAQPTASSIEQQVAASLIPPRQSFTYDEAPTPVSANTTWQWDDALAQRHPTGAPALPNLVSDSNLTPTRLSVAVNSAGAVEHVVVEPIIDDVSTPVDKDVAGQAVNAARKIRFDPVTTPGLQWGRITIFWRYAAKPREDVQPTPPTTGG
jgi:hypothetical protein